MLKIERQGYSVRLSEWPDMVGRKSTKEADSIRALKIFFIIRITVF